MTLYRPLLKAKPGEWQAFGALPPTVASGIRAVFEIGPDADLVKAVANPTAKAIRYLPAGSVVGIDCGFVDQAQQHAGTGTAIPEWIAEQLDASDVGMVPVARPDDAAGVLRSLSRVARRLPEPEAYLRLGDDDELPAPIATSDLARMQRSLRLGPDRIHLILDYRSVANRRAAAAYATAAQSVITWATAAGPWASITLAGGAFPESISDLPTGRATPVQRWDAQLWSDVSATGLDVDFGDYGVSHPALATGGRAPLPNLRYTHDDTWQVWREKKARPGNESFFTLAHRVVAHPAYGGAACCWGDSELHRCSRSAGGAGTATQWRAYGTSHHLTTVVHRLATLGAP
jgi:hypothetical protein